MRRQKDVLFAGGITGLSGPDTCGPAIAALPGRPARRPFDQAAIAVTRGMLVLTLLHASFALLGVEHRPFRRRRRTGTCDE